MDEQIKELERTFWNTMQNADPEAARAMTDETCIVVGAQGVGEVNPDTMAKMLETATWTLDGYTFDDEKTKIRMIGKDVAIIAYPVHEDLQVDGEPVSFDAFDASVWVRKGDTWVCALHTESGAGDPYGRDRTKPMGGKSKPASNGKKAASPSS